MDGGVASRRVVVSVKRRMSNLWPKYDQSLLVSRGFRCNHTRVKRMLGYLCLNDFEANFINRS